MQRESGITPKIFQSRSQVLTRQMTAGLPRCGGHMGTFKFLAFPYWGRAKRLRRQGSVAQQRACFLRSFYLPSRLGAPYFGLIQVQRNATTRVSRQPRNLWYDLKGTPMYSYKRVKGRSHTAEKRKPMYTSSSSSSKTRGPCQHAFNIPNNDYTWHELLVLHVLTQSLRSRPVCSTQLNL